MRRSLAPSVRQAIQSMQLTMLLGDHGEKSYLECMNTYNLHREFNQWSDFCHKITSPS